MPSTKKFAKVLVDRLKYVLPTIIFKHQSALAKDRLISNDIIIAFETLHCIKTNNSGSMGFIALKLDISKAYD